MRKTVLFYSLFAAACLLAVSVDAQEISVQEYRELMAQVQKNPAAALLETLQFSAPDTDDAYQIFELIQELRGKKLPAAKLEFMLRKLAGVYSILPATHPYSYLFEKHPIASYKGAELLAQFYLYKLGLQHELYQGASMAAYSFSPYLRAMDSLLYIWRTRPVSRKSRLWGLIIKPCLHRVGSKF